MANDETLEAGLRALAPNGGAGGPLVLVDGDVRITVRAHSDSSSSTVRVVSSYDANAGGSAGAVGGAYRGEGALRAIRPMRITLRPETAGDREGKERGHSVEMQTGDPRFDAAVYVDTPTTDTAVLAAVLNAEARAAVLDVFALRADAVTIDDLFGDVRVDFSGFPRLVDDDDRARKLVAAFGRLARAMPRVTATGEKHAPPPWFGRIALATIVAAIGVPSLPVAYLYVAQAFGATTGVGLGELVLKEGDGLPRLVGFLGALGFGLASVPVVRAFAVPVLGGRSDSRGRIRFLHGVLFALFAEVGFVVGSALGFALFFAY